MSDLIMKKEIRKAIRESGVTKSPKMVCSVVRLLSMKHKDIDVAKASTIAKELLA